MSVSSPARPTPPKYTTGVRAVFSHQLRRTRRSWGSSIAAGLATPTLFFLAIGAGLGSQIDDAELATLGVSSYMDFIGPGILIVTAIGSSELGVAHVLWIGFRGLVAAACFLIVLAVAGTLASWLAVFIAAIAVLVAWAHAGPLVALTVGLQQENIFAMLSRIVNGVEIARHLALGDLSSIDALHLGYLVLIAAVGFFLVQRQFRKHLDI